MADNGAWRQRTSPTPSPSLTSLPAGASATMSGLKPVPRPCGKPRGRGAPYVRREVDRRVDRTLDVLAPARTPAALLLVSRAHDILARQATRPVLTQPPLSLPCRSRRRRRRRRAPGSWRAHRQGRDRRRAAGRGCAVENEPSVAADPSVSRARRPRCHAPPPPAASRPRRQNRPQSAVRAGPPPGSCGRPWPRSWLPEARVGVDLSRAPCFAVPSNPSYRRGMQRRAASAVAGVADAGTPPTGRPPTARPQPASPRSRSSSPAGTSTKLLYRFCWTACRLL